MKCCLAHIKFELGQNLLRSAKNCHAPAPDTFICTRSPYHVYRTLYKNDELFFLEFISANTPLRGGITSH